MKKFIFLLLNSLCALAFSQNYSRCKIFQYEERDSLYKVLVSEHNYNQKGQLESFYEKGYKDYAKAQQRPDTRYFNFYKDTLLQKQTSCDFKGDSSISLYFYNAKGKQIRFEYYELKLKYNTDWKKKSEHLSTYDSHGNLSLKTLKYVEPASVVQKKYRYDSTNRVIELEIVVDSVKEVVAEYRYDESGFKMIYTSFDDKGNALHLKQGGGYAQQIISFHKLNSHGQDTEVIIRDEKDNFLGKEVFIYNNDNKISKHIEYSNNIYHVDITHVYYYE